MNFGGDHPAHGHGKISPRCVPEGASDGKNTGSWQRIACMYSDSANFGKICVPCIRKAPQSAVGECTARASCRQGALSPSEAPKSRTARKSCHPLMDLPLRRGSCPSNRIAGSSFNGPAPVQGWPPIRAVVRGPFSTAWPLLRGVPTPQRPANARHLPIPATCRAHHSQRQAVDELRRRPSGAWPTVLPSPEGPPTTPSRRAGRQRDAAQSWAWIPEPWTSGRRTAGGGRRPGRACGSAAKNAHRKDESLLAEL